MSLITAGPGQQGYSPSIRGPIATSHGGMGLLPSMGGNYLPGNAPYYGGTDTNDYDSILANSGILDNSDGSPEQHQQAYDVLKSMTLGPDHLLPGQRNVDDTTQGLINEQIRQATGIGNIGNDGLASGIQASWLQGTDQSSLADHPNQVSQSASSLGGGDGPDSAFAEALSRNNQNNYQVSLQSLKSNIAFQAPQNQMAQMNQISGELGMNEQLKIQNYQQQYQYMLQRRQMDNQAAIAAAQGRSSALSGILGGVASVAGMFLGA